jgi:hypothetical protein
VGARLGADGGLTQCFSRPGGRRWELPHHPRIQAEGPALVYAELELDGTFRLLDLDPGVWTVTAKLETEDGKTREIKRQVTVREDDGDIDLTIDLATGPALDPQDRR